MNIEMMAEMTGINTRDLTSILNEMAAMIKERLQRAGYPLTEENVGKMIMPCFEIRAKMIQSLLDCPIKMKEFQETMLDELIREGK